MKNEVSIYKGNQSEMQKLLFLVGIAALLFFIFRNRISQYNEERVEIERDERNRIKAITVHRSTR